jgi:hypothetical protein
MSAVPQPVQQPSAAIIDRSEIERLKSLRDVFGDRFAKTFHSPVVFIPNQVLESPVSQRFYKKDFEYLSKQLYLEYQYRSWKGFNGDILERFSEVTLKKMEAIRTLMTNTINRLQKLLDQNGYKVDGSLFPATLRIAQLPIIAAQARQYFEILTMLDRVFLLSGTCNLYGVIDSKQRAEAEMVCKRAVRAFRSIMQFEVVKVYREGDRLVKEQHAAGHADPKMVELVAQQGESIKAFDTVSDEESHTENGMNLGGADAGQVIDDAAAVSTAAAATKKRTPRKSEPAVAPAPAAAAAAGAAAS